MHFQNNMMLNFTAIDEARCEVVKLARSPGIDEKSITRTILDLPFLPGFSGYHLGDLDGRYLSTNN